MASKQSDVPFTPFILLTTDLIIVPTPIAISIPAYRAMYQHVHATPKFCAMGFGPRFVARSWTDAETRDVIQTRDINLSWKPRGLGDFAVGLRPEKHREQATKSSMGRILRNRDREIRIVEGSDIDTDYLNTLVWVGYAGIRDAIITSLRNIVTDIDLPPWQEMVEVRYGVTPEFWGKGVARRAADAVMLWAASERGVRRFIAETEKANTRSGSVLEKMGFRKSETDYWKEPSEYEWERIVD